MERPQISGFELEMREQSPRRGRGLMKGAASILVVAALLVGLAYLFGGSSLRALLRAATPEQKRNYANERVKAASTQVELYKLQHGDKPPDFGRYPNWEQLTQPTDRAGNLVDAAKSDRAVGPYMKNVPKNPLNGMSTVAVVKGRLQPGDAVPGGRIVGFVFETSKGRLFATDDSGTRLLGPEAPAGGKK